MLIKDICREVKDRIHLTNQDIADQADMPVSTVSNYFSGNSKAPSVYTVGPICAVLGVSLDKYFGIKSTESPAETSENLARIADLEQKCQGLEKDITHKDEIIAMKEDAVRQCQREIDRRRPIIYGLLLITGLVVIAFIAYLLHFDLTNPSYGLFRG